MVHVVGDVHLPAAGLPQADLEISGWPVSCPLLQEEDGASHDADGILPNLTLTPENRRMDRGTSRVLVTFLGLYLLAQVLIPFRHLLYPGDVNWTEEDIAFPGG